MHRAVAATLLIAGLYSPAPAQAQNAEKIAGSVPVEVDEVTEAGSWTDGSTTGTFRAIMISTPGQDAVKVSFFVQLLQFGNDLHTKSIKKIVDVKQIADLNLTNPALNVQDSSAENEVTFLILNYNAVNDADTRYFIKVTSTGDVEVKPAPTDEDDSASAPAGGDDKTKPGAEGAATPPTPAAK